MMHCLSIVATSVASKRRYISKPKVYVWKWLRDGSRKQQSTSPTDHRNTRSFVVYEHRKVSVSGDTWHQSPFGFERVVTNDAGVAPVWKKITNQNEDSAETAQKQTHSVAQANDLVLRHFFPVGYPDTVSTSYREYAQHTFIASIAGSASMVLSTQSLLLAIGVVGTNATQTGILAGAINWVLKDGLSQAGAILWTSISARNYDEHPKTWRMIAAITLDMAAAIELSSPFLTETRGAVLAAACAAGTLKNVGFLTASASRAALHQELTQNGRNLADVTAKAGSQSILAGLLGTGLGLAVSNILQGRQDILLCYGVCFIGLATVHQSFNYFAVKSIAFNTLNLHRASLVLEHFIRDGTWLSPVQVCRMEPILFTTRSLSNVKELQVGVGIEYHPSATFSDDSRFLLSKDGDMVYITFMKEATPTDQVIALYHALLMKKGLSEHAPTQNVLDGLTNVDWDIEGTELEPRGTSIRISVDLKH